MIAEKKQTTYRFYGLAIAAAMAEKRAGTHLLLVDDCDNNRAIVCPIAEKQRYQSSGYTEREI